MAKRKGLSNKDRFEVFKRDSFKCQYCGKPAPEVVLHVDHILPVSEGGKNNILNLITSCFECNNGKSNIKLSDNSAVSLQKKQLDELNERREQLEMLIKWKNILEDKTFEIDTIVKYFNEKNKCDISLTDIGIRDMTALLKKFSASVIINGISDAHDKYFGTMPIEDLWDKTERMVNFITAPENDRNKMKFYGAIKARFGDTSGYNYWNTAATNKMIRFLYKIIDSGDYEFTYGDLFSILNSHHSYNQFRQEIESVYDSLNK